MVFSSTVFLFIFLLVVFSANLLLVNIKLKNALLLLASLLFYAWGEPFFVLVMIFSVFVNYLLAMLIHKNERNKKLYLILTVVFNIGMLAVFKYAAFFMTSLNSVTGLGLFVPHIALPVGISFFTFQAMSYTIDVYRKTTKVQPDFFKVLLYVSLFPQLIAGPIVIYHDVEEQINERSVTPERVANGIRRFIVGLSKKILIANAMGELADSIFKLSSSELNISIAWIGAIAYCFQIYFDFSGYSDMAIGLGHMFGFDFKENFNYPYISRSIKEFWRRWHISLSSWFRDYLYIPLGGNRKGIVRQGINMGIVFLCTGLWHGSEWTFVIWGIFHGVFLILETYKVIQPDKWPKFFRHLYSLLVVIIGFTIFRAASMTQAFDFIGKMFSGFTFTASHTATLFELLSTSKIVTMVIAIFASMPTLNLMKNPGAKLVKSDRLFKVLQTGSYAVSIVLFLLCIFTLSASTFNPFIYFRF